MNLTKTEKRKIIDWTIKSLHTRHEDWTITRPLEHLYRFADNKTGFVLFFNTKGVFHFIHPVEIQYNRNRDYYFYVKRWDKSGLRKLLLEIVKNKPTEGFASFLENVKSANCVEQGTKRMPPSNNH